MLSNLSMMPTALALSAETLELMWQTPLLGIGMVFAVLAVLWGVLVIFKLVFAGRTPKEPKPVKAKPVEQAPVQAAAPAPAAQSNDAELVAIITAAVAAYIAEEGNDTYSGGFRVVSFKRVRDGRTWNTK